MKFIEHVICAVYGLTPARWPRELRMVATGFMLAGFFRIAWLALEIVTSMYVSAR